MANESKENKVTSGVECESDSAVQPASNVRRRLIRGGLSAGPVLLALSGKSALATGTVAGCRFPSTWASLNPALGGNAAGASHHPGQYDSDCKLGRSPGFWRQPQKRKYWPASVKPDTLPYSGNPNQCSWSGLSNCGLYRGDGTKVASVELVGGGDRTFSQVLCAEDAQGASGSLLWHCCAAYLNALAYPGYPLSTADVVAMSSGTFQKPSMPQPWFEAEIKDFLNQTYGAQTLPPVSWLDAALCTVS